MQDSHLSSTPAGVEGSGNACGACTQNQHFSHRAPPIRPAGFPACPTGTGGSWPVSTDRIIWAVAAWELYKVTGDGKWLDAIYPYIKQSVEDDILRSMERLDIYSLQEFNDIMRRKPRNSKDGIFANGMGADTLFQGIVIAALTLGSYFIGINHAGVGIAEAVANDQAGLEGMTMAFLTLSMVEMFHSLNMRSRRASIFGLPTQNIWSWGAFALSLVLTYIVIETPLSTLFNFAELDMVHYGMAMGLAALIIPIVEIYKAIMRSVEKDK